MDSRNVDSKKKNEKYYLILNAASKVFATYGFHRAQVARIAREAGVADGTIYLYFKRKEDILIELFRYRFGNWIEQVRQELARIDDVREALRMFCKLHYEQVESDIDYAYVAQLELRQADIEMRREIGQIFKPYLTIIEELLNKGIEQGVFRPDINVKLARHLIFGAMDEVVTSWIISGQKYSLSAQTEGTVQVILKGIEAE